MSSTTSRVILSFMDEMRERPNRVQHDSPISLDDYDAAIFDLDGVITQTAKVHAAAWKAMFDEYLMKHSPDGYRPFDIQGDYKNYVDGKPRYDGVRSFLTSRDIHLPDGDTSDPPDEETVCGLGNRKNELFLNKLRTEGVKVYDSTVSLLRSLRNAGLGIAVVSSSRNARAVLEAAGIAGMFDARVDGIEREALGLAGKPAPDMFLEACRRLGHDPRRSIGVEDAISGVEAIHNAGLGCVIGVNRGNQESALFDHGADRVVTDLAELRWLPKHHSPVSDTTLPSALEALERIIPDNKSLILFLDYDGTLTPIIAQPSAANLSEDMRNILVQLSTQCPIAIISGRDLADVRKRVGIDGIWYAGSHGFDIAGPGRERKQYQQGREYLSTLDAAEQRLRRELNAIPSCEVERKRFSIAIHYRRVDESRIPDIEHIVEGVHDTYVRLRLSRGKKIFELQPAIDWNKGKALRWLMQTLEMQPPQFRPIYIGDDVTDEDAFAELEKDGTGIVVAEPEQSNTVSSKAAYRLNNPDEVWTFLSRLSKRLAG